MLIILCREKKLITNKGEIKISWENNSSKNQKTQLPVAAYSHSYVRLNGEKMDKKEVTDLGALIVNAKPGLNEVVVGYRPIISIKLALVLIYRFDDNNFINNKKDKENFSHDII